MNLVIIGAGMAAIKLVELLSVDYIRALGEMKITIFSDEKMLPYNRILLSSILSREVTQDSSVLFSDSWFQDQGISLVRKQVTEVSAAVKTVVAGGMRYPFDILVFATGSNVFFPPLLRHSQRIAGVVGFRRLKDLQHIESYQKGQSALVIGGGLLGLEAAYGLALRGLSVTLVHRSGYLLNRQLNAKAAAILQAQLESRGVTIVLNCEVIEVQSELGVISGVVLSDGRVLAVNVMVVAVGVEPNVALARASGIDVRRGIVVDSEMRTSMNDIYAIGECVEFNRQCFGLVEPCYRQASVLSQHLMGMPAKFELKPESTRLKITGINVFSAGDISGKPSVELCFGSHYKCLFIRNNNILGVILIGDSQDGLWFFDLMLRQQDISGVRNRLVFGPRYCAEGLNSA